MINPEDVEEAKSNFSAYLKEGMLKKEKSTQAMKMNLKNSDLSFKTAEKLMGLRVKTISHIFGLLYAATIQCFISRMPSCSLWATKLGEK